MPDSIIVKFDETRWPDFTVAELSCKCGCGTFIQDEHALDTLQALRGAMGEPLIIASATRCAAHNAAEGGKPGSEHPNGRAFDIKIGDHDRRKLYEAARRVGFTGFGFGATFLHVDTGRLRHWDYGKESKKAWAGIMPTAAKED